MNWIIGIAVAIVALKLLAPLVGGIAWWVL